MGDLVDHLERHLGLVAGGWATDADGRKMPFQVVTFERGPFQGARVLATLGLSHAPLRLGDARAVRQELIVMFRESDGPRNLPGVLQQVAEEALARGTAYSAGDVLGPRGELVPGSSLEALYVTAPVYLPDSFHVFRPVDGDAILIAWLVPISASEAEFARAHGRVAFEEELERADPDLLDFHRPFVV